MIPASVEIRPVDPEHPDARYCLGEYVAELNRRSTRGFDPSVGATALPHEVRPPAGEFFVAYLHGEAVGCGAVKHHADAPAEIKRMWIAPRARGRGLGRRLLEVLEECARAGGAQVAHIETSAVLAEALALYRSAGWAEVAPFNDEPFADHWLEKSLAHGPEPTPFEVHESGALLHGTKADLAVGDLLEPGRRSNFGEDRTANHVYVTETLDAATWGAELAQGEGRGRIYIVEPTGPLEDDPNVTDKKFPGNPTRSYRTRSPVRIVGEIVDWVGHSPEKLQAMRDALEELRRRGEDVIYD